MSSEAYMALREELRALGIDDKLEATIMKKVEVAYNEGYSAGWNTALSRIVGKPKVDNDPRDDQGEL